MKCMGVSSLFPCLLIKLEALTSAVLVDTPELAGDTIVWLAAGRKTWLTGRYVSCNWDMEELERKRDEIVKGDLLKFRLAV